MRSQRLEPVALFGMLLPAMAASAGDVVLKTNPFQAPPPAVSKKDAQEAVKVEEPQAAMELRGTMAAGEYSLADIGGEILSVGQVINGYKLVAIYQRHVVLEKNDTQVTLLIDAETEDAK